MYVYAVLVCVNTRMLQCAYGSQRKPLVVGTCVPSSLRQGLLVACCYATYARLDGIGVLGFSRSTSSLTLVSQGLQTCATIPLFTSVLGFEHKASDFDGKHLTY